MQIRIVSCVVECDGLTPLPLSCLLVHQITDCLSYAHATKHEKIKRGISLGMALIAYGQEDASDGLVEQMLTDQDYLIRYGGVYTVALAFVGTASNKAIRKLLHIAVTDVNDDVRRAAVTALGFVLLRTPEQVCVPCCSFA